MNQFKINATAVLLGLSLSAGIAAAAFERAVLVSEEADYDRLRRSCTYETISGSRITLSIRGATCPLSIEYDPETGRVRR